MTAAGGLLGFGAVADGSLADYDGVYSASVDETGAASDANSALATFANTQIEAGSASDASSSVASLVASAIENGAATDIVSSLGVFIATSSEDAPANDNVSSALVTNPSRFEDGAASDDIWSTVDFVASATEAVSAATSTSVDVGISIVEGGLAIDINDDSLLGFGPIGGGSLASFGGSLIDVTYENLSVTGTHNPSIVDALTLYDAIIPSNIITYSLLDVLTVSEFAVSEYGYNFIYEDTEIMCVRSEPRMMRVAFQWKTSVDPEEQDARANPDYKPRAENRKRAC